MKKTFKVLLNIFALFSLIACGHKSSKSEISQSSNNSIETTDKQQSSSEEEISSYYESIASADTSINSEGSSSSESIYYHVTFVNYDDSVLYEVDVLEGEEAVYQGETPTKEADDDFKYEFDGWDIDLTSIVSDVTAKAQYKSVPKKEWGPINWFQYQTYY